MRKPRPLTLCDDDTQEAMMKFLFNNDSNARKYPIQIRTPSWCRSSNFSRAEIRRVQRWFDKALKSLP